MSDTDTLLTKFLDLVSNRDREGAVGLLVAASDAGMGVDQIITTVLSPTQLEVGRRWSTKEWTVAHEHSATAICEAALNAVTLRPRPGPTRAKVALGCVEQEWHALPAHMFAELLQDRGHEVLFLGASLSTNGLKGLLEDMAPTALVMSCSISMNLPGAARVVDAAHAVGCPVLAGGSGFGSNPVRANAIGADGWAANADDASRLLCQWAEERKHPHPGRRTTSGENVRLEADRDRVVDAALGLLTPLKAYDATQLGRARADFSYLVRFLQAALLTGDDTVFGEFVQWYSPTLEVAEIPSSELPVLLACLRQALSDAFPAAALIVDNALVAAGGQPAPRPRWS